MIDRLPHEKGFHVSWDQIHRDARALAWRLDGKGPDGGAWRAVVGSITRGGLVPAMIDWRESWTSVLSIPISVKSYSHQSQSAEAIVTKSPQADLMGDGTGILIVDDLVDTGKTATGTGPPPVSERPILPRSTPNPLASRWSTATSRKCLQDTWIFFPWDMALAICSALSGPCD